MYDRYTHSHVLVLIVNILQFLYCNFDTIVLQTVLSVDVLSREEIVTKCLIGEWKERRETEGILHWGLKMNNLKEHY